MEHEYLLDTNAFYNMLKAMKLEIIEHNTLPASVATIIGEKLVVSSITEVEIVSVLGKYARGSQGGASKCNCIISPEGHICQNSRYTKPRKNGIVSALRRGWNSLMKSLKEILHFFP